VTGQTILYYRQPNGVSGQRERERAPETRGPLNAALVHKAQVLPVLLITSGVSTLVMILGHAHLQGHEPEAQRVVTIASPF